MVLEKRTMVYALETLELLTTLDTHPNPKASWELQAWQQKAEELRFQSSMRTSRAPTVSCGCVQPACWRMPAGT